MWFKKKVQPLDQSVLDLDGVSSATVRDFASGCLITGMTGGGKSSGPLSTILRGFCRLGMGGVLTTAKPTDVDMIRKICAEEGRLDSLIVWDGENQGFNFLAWISAQQGENFLENAVEFLMRVSEMKQASAAIPGSSGDQFWTDIKLQMARNTLPVLHHGTNNLTVVDILRFVRSAPTSREQMRDPSWQRTSFFFKTLALAAPKLSEADGERISAFWTEDWVAADNRTRGNMLVSFTTALDALNSGWLRRAFCEDTTIVPELCFDGAIIVLDMPALTRHEDGVFGQQIFVYAYQQAVLSRNTLPARYRNLPVFLIIDEFPLFCNSRYALFLGTCRDSMCCTVLVAQSLPSIAARMMGPNGQDYARALVANCAIRVWTANNCTFTNEEAAKTIGKTRQTRRNYSHNSGHSENFGTNLGMGESWGTSSQSGGSSSHGQGGSSSGSSWSSGSTSGSNDSRGRNRGSASNSGQSWGENEVLEYAIEPAAFGSGLLKTGGPAHGNRVSAIWYQAGRVFPASGGSALLLEFPQ